MTQNSQSYFRSLDGLRALAVGLVWLSHAGSPFLKSGGVGVDVFFVLSGFLITSILLREVDASGKINLKRFYIRRSLRLMPCLLFTIALFVGLEIVSGKPIPFGNLLIVLSYTTNWFRALTDVNLGSLGHCWSLAIEEQFYLVWPFVVFAVSKFGKSNRARAFALLAVFFTLVAYRLVVANFVSPQRIYFGLDTHADGLVIGSFLAFFLASSQGKKEYQWIFSRVLAPIALLSLGLLANQLSWEDAAMIRFGYMIAALASAVLVFSLAFYDRWWLDTLLSNSVLCYIGRISYGLYLIHLPVFKFITEETALGGYQAVAVKFVASFLIAVASYHLVEKPVLALKDKLAPHGG